VNLSKLSGTFCGIFFQALQKLKLNLKKLRTSNVHVGKSGEKVHCAMLATIMCLPGNADAWIED